MFLHRLWAIGEEGRTTLQRVTGSPLVAQGAECITGFYDQQGDMILACSGHLRFAEATSDAVKKMIEWYSLNPGIRDGDQFFTDDPYIAGAHVYDQMVLKPVFYRDQLAVWISTGTHTADTGGVLRGQATEIFHEGVRIGGIKLVEDGQVREDIFRTIISYCRAPDLGEFSGRPLPSGGPYIGVYHEYICPGCGTLLQVDVFCDLMGGDEPLWDAKLEV